MITKYVSTHNHAFDAIIHFFTCGDHFMKITHSIIKKAILCILCLFVFLGGIGIGWRLGHLTSLQQQQFNSLHAIYLYDSQEKVEQWFRDVEDTSSWIMGLSKKEKEEVLVELKENTPLAVIGPFGIFHNHDTNEYVIRERESFHTIVQSFIGNTRQGMMIVHSKTLKDWEQPHAVITFTYDEGGAFVRGKYCTTLPDGMINRIYVDSNGNGQFEQMIVLENSVPVVYKMVNMTWTKVEGEKLDDVVK